MQVKGVAVVTATGMHSPVPQCAVRHCLQHTCGGWESTYCVGCHSTRSLAWVSYDLKQRAGRDGSSRFLLCLYLKSNDTLAGLPGRKKVI